jgi:hypothetical protein
MAEPNIQQLLNAMAEPFKEAVAPSGNQSGIDDMPDDDYQGRVDAFDFVEGKKKAGALYFIIRTSIQNHPEFGGRGIDFLHEVTDPERHGWLKKDLATLGADMENFSLPMLNDPDVMTPLLDVPILIGIYTNKKGYKNQIIRERLDFVESDLGVDQGKEFEQTEMAPAKPAAAAKPADCICPDPGAGNFDENCPVAGHGIPF